jgi:hypothetical protein
MSTVAIEINDAGIVVADRASVRFTEPGYAYVDGGKILTGGEAYAQARLHPRRSANSFWERLSLSPGSSSVDGIGSAAELAYAQLSNLWQRTGSPDAEVIVLVPSHYDRDQLGILLGLLQECAIEVKSLVDPAVAAAFRPYPNCQLVYVDAGLHRVSVTPLIQGEDVAAAPSRSIDSIGLASIMDRLARRVAELFVSETRFDPFHSAASEQIVYERLPGWLKDLQHSDGAIELTLPQDTGDLSVEVERDQLLRVSAGFYRAIVQLIAQCREAGERMIILLSDRLAAMPGLLSELERLDDAAVVQLNPGDAALGVIQHFDGIARRDGEVRLIKRLPWREPSADVPASRDSSNAAAKAAAAAVGTDDASHIVYRGIAYPIDGAGVLIGREPPSERRTIVLNGGQSGVSRTHCELVRRDGELKLLDMSRHGTYVNEKRVSGEISLHTADVIRIGSPGEQIQVIRLERSDGA